MPLPGLPLTETAASVRLLHLLKARSPLCPSLAPLPMPSNPIERTVTSVTSVAENIGSAPMAKKVVAPSWPITVVRKPSWMLPTR